MIDDELRDLTDEVLSDLARKRISEDFSVEIIKEDD